MALEELMPCLKDATCKFKGHPLAAALDWLERDYQLHLAGRMYFPVDPNIRRLAHEPRYISLMHRLGAAD